MHYYLLVCFAGVSISCSYTHEVTEVNSSFDNETLENWGRNANLYIFNQDVMQDYSFDLSKSAMAWWCKILHTYKYKKYFNIVQEVHSTYYFKSRRYASTSSMQNYFTMAFFFQIIKYKYF